MKKVKGVEKKNIMENVSSSVGRWSGVCFDCKEDERGEKDRKE